MSIKRLHMARRGTIRQPPRVCRSTELYPILDEFAYASEPVSAESIERVIVNEITTKVPVVSNIYQCAYCGDIFRTTYSRTLHSVLMHAPSENSIKPSTE